MDTFTQLCQEIQQIQAVYGTKGKAYRTLTAKALIKAKEHFTPEEYTLFLSEVSIDSDMANTLISLLTFFKYQEDVVDPLWNKLTAILEEIQQILHAGIKGNEGLLDGLHDLRCEAYHVVDELDSLDMDKRDISKDWESRCRNTVDAFFERWFINLPNDEIEWLIWPLDTEEEEEAYE